ncbi:MAG: hypothetical protein EZS28_018386 [Streblomastix strix]|uniref:Uncharacterized protein n=1 Tax=Streblomastix strix TaxID=222440 RepID=A0A5J4VV88_9EUKA|nr:MAG: hypothetical protein EZS28_018386 [Streblomastix strix]
MSNVMTILGTAIGGGNAITYLSFSGNRLIPAKNSSIITNNYDETMAGNLKLLMNSAVSGGLTDIVKP